jgi:hypothetical protein
MLRIIKNDIRERNEMKKLTIARKTMPLLSPPSPLNGLVKKVVFVMGLAAVIPIPEKKFLRHTTHMQACLSIARIDRVAH